jgi:serine protease AprX
MKLKLNLRIQNNFFKMRRSLLVILFYFLLIGICPAQEYWVFFKNKSNCTFNPYTYFDHKAIDRRIINEVSLYDSTDFPVNQNYIDVVSKLADSTGFASRWFNALDVYANEDQITKISLLPFVSVIEPMESMAIEASYKDDGTDYDTTLTKYMKELLEWQTLRMGRPYFQKAGLDGKGVRIAVLDGGFPSLDSSAAFKHLTQNGRIIKTWDFVRNRENVYSYNQHGILVLSCIAGMYKDQEMGLAPGAEFLLARTELNSEHYSEEKNWLAAMEWADKNGAQIINSSVGYTYHRYFTDQMDGKTSLVSRAANMAARKGILVVNCAGNDAEEKWQIICTPADSDSVLTVGGIDPITGYHIGFSSFGPTSDKRMKPNVSAFADVVAEGPKGVANVQGTSFSCPLVTGFAACVLQANPNIKCMDLFHLIEKSGEMYPYFDYAHGYGVPQASKIVNVNFISVATFSFVLSKENISVFLRDFKYSDDERTSQLLLFYNIMDTDGHIEEFHVLMVYQKEALTVPLSRLSPGEKLNVYFRGYTASWSIKPIE